MPRDRERAWLNDMLSRAERAESFVAGIDRAAFGTDLKTQEAVVRCLEVIGEACKRVSDETLGHRSEIDWRQIRGMRDRLIHNYDQIDLDIVWRTVQEDLQPMKAAVRHLLTIVP